VLQLNRNQIADFDPGVFRGLTSVITLWLKDNQLTRVYAGMFDDMTSLRQLHLQKNGLLDVPSRIFNMYMSLQDLDLISSSGAFCEALSTAQPLVPGFGYFANARLPRQRAALG